MNSTFYRQLQALGRYTLPASIFLSGSRYRLTTIFKHDFFAVTALYTLAATPHTQVSPKSPSSPCQSSRQDRSFCAASPAADTIPPNPKPFSSYSKHPKCHKSEPRLIPEGGNGQAPPPRIILKIARWADFLGLPLAWLGRRISRHEITMLRQIQDVPGTPRLLGRFQDMGFAYAYIEGQTLDERPTLPDDFFDQFEMLLRRIHRKGMAYVDLNKRGNIIRGSDGAPHLIDFQIACKPQATFSGLKPLQRRLVQILQQEDYYHLLKHKRRLMGHRMDPLQKQMSRKVSFWIALHRAIARPLINLRRRLLAFIGDGGRISSSFTNSHKETDPTRWSR